MQKLKLQGHFRLVHRRNGEILRYLDSPNQVMDDGLDNILDVMFDASAQSTNWYIGLIDNAGFTAIEPTDTIAAHPGWTEWVAYVEATRQLWNTDPALSRVIQNPIASLAIFSINAIGIIKGSFVVNDNTKGGGAGLLWAAALFEEGDLTVSGGDSVEVQYVLVAT